MIQIMHNFYNFRRKSVSEKYWKCVSAVHKQKCLLNKFVKWENTDCRGIGLSNKNQVFVLLPFNWLPFKVIVLKRFLNKSKFMFKFLRLSSYKYTSIFISKFRFLCFFFSRFNYSNIGNSQTKTHFFRLWQIFGSKDNFYTKHGNPFCFERFERI